MITGAHAIIYSTHPEADRSFLRDVLSLPYVDAGEGWLIFSLPPTEVAVHPSEENGVHELYLTCDDVADLVGSLAKRGIDCGPVRDQGWGRLTDVTLPGGGTIGIYEPRHRRPEARPARRRRKASRRPGPKTPPRVPGRRRSRRAGR
jgi:hypothetical protein